MKYYAQHIYTRQGIAKGKILPDKKILHIGCGNSKLEGAVGIDVLKLPAVDIVHNLDMYPWPFRDNSFDIIYGHSVVEHVADLVAFIDECWRILKPGGRIVMTVPYFRSIDSFTDPTHKHFFTSNSLDYFLKIPGSLAAYSYSKHRFDLVKFWYGWPQESNNPLVRRLKKFMYSHPKMYDQYLSFFFPMKILVWELEK